MIELSPASIGILGSVVTAVLTLIPILGATDLRRNITAIVVLIAGVFMFGDVTFTDIVGFANTFALAVVFALSTYKMFLQNLLVKPAQKALGITD